MSEEMSDYEIRLKCGCCGRNFHSEVLEKHEPICYKNQKNSQKRKNFDSFKMRIKDTDIVAFGKENSLRPQHLQPQKLLVPPKKSNWRTKSEEFRKIMQQARSEVTSVPNSEVNPEYIQCPHCTRRFSQNAAPGHISFCKEQASRPKLSSTKIDVEQDKYNKRKQYKAPRLKAKTANTPKKLPQSQIPTAPRVRQNTGPESTKEIPSLNRTRDISLRKNILLNKKPTTDNKDETYYTNHNNKHPDFPVKVNKLKQTSDNSLSSARKLSSTQPHGTNQLHKSLSDKDLYGKIQNLNLIYPLNDNKDNNNNNISSNRTSNLNFSPGIKNDYSHVGGRHDPPLNEYKTPMSKFCYECGYKYVVPQAKYCCQCGTKRV